jgi:hypothetical protein
MDFGLITHPLRLARGSRQAGSGKGSAVNHSSAEIHVGDPQAGDQPRTRTTDRKTSPSSQSALSSDVRDMNYEYDRSEQQANKGSLMIRKVLVGAAGAAIAVGLAASAGARPVTPQPQAAPDFLAAVRAAGITGTDPAMLEDGYSVCRRLWVRQMSGTQIAAGLVHDYPGLTSDQAGQFVLAAYHDLCPQPGGAYDYWAYSTS